jgi:hypothetical protein
LLFVIGIVVCHHIIIKNKMQPISNGNVGVTGGGMHQTNNANNPNVGVQPQPVMGYGGPVPQQQLQQPQQQQPLQVPQPPQMSGMQQVPHQQQQLQQAASMQQLQRQQQVVQQQQQQQQQFQQQHIQQLLAAQQQQQRQSLPGSGGINAPPMMPLQPPQQQQQQISMAPPPILQQQQVVVDPQLQNLPIRAYLDQTVVPILLDGNVVTLLDFYTGLFLVCKYSNITHCRLVSFHFTFVSSQ